MGNNTLKVQVNKTCDLKDTLVVKDKKYYRNAIYCSGDSVISLLDWDDKNVTIKIWKGKFDKHSISCVELMKFNPAGYFELPSESAKVFRRLGEKCDVMAGDVWCPAIIGNVFEHTLELYYYNGAERSFQLTPHSVDVVPFQSRQTTNITPTLPESISLLATKQYFNILNIH
jgi:hypothetical protein